MTFFPLRFASVALFALVAWTTATLAAEEVGTILVDRDTTLPEGRVLRSRIVIVADGITLDGNGSQLVGPGVPGELDTFAEAGVGIDVRGCVGVTIKNLAVRGFQVGARLTDCRGCGLTDCDASDNWHNPKHGWGDGPQGGGFALVDCRECSLRRCRANRVWNGCELLRSNECSLADSDFSHCSNVCLKLFTARDNLVTDSDLSWGIRIDREAGEVHARDSTCVLLESGSDHNRFERNDITHGGDGVFIRSLNNWVSRFNVFVDNDCSWANNNCVESWSPDNTWIRNRANHGSYGFWLGGSDHSTLIGNEAAFNGLPEGNHHAPEPGFSHAGIAIVGGPSSHTLLADNHVHDNAGAGIAFRGDVGTQGAAWKTFHWVGRGNRIERNRIGVYGRWGDWIDLTGNRLKSNDHDFDIEETTRLTIVEADVETKRAPQAAILGPSRAVVGRPVSFDASATVGAKTLRWDVGGVASEQVRVERVFDRPGVHRVGLTATSGSLADLAFLDVVVSEPVDRELGTEDELAAWTYAFGEDPAKKGQLRFRLDSDAVVGKSSLRIDSVDYPGFDATAILSAPRGATWDWSKKKTLHCWFKAVNPDATGWQDAGPVFTIVTPSGKATFTPGTKERPRNPLRESEPSEARWLWSRLELPLAADAVEASGWTRTDDGAPNFSRVTSLEATVDSWGAPAFSLWLDGLSVR